MRSRPNWLRFASGAVNLWCLSPGWKSSDPMLFHPARIDGVFRIEMERRIDERGFFARTFCKREFEERNLVSRFVQCNLSSNKLRGTLRGMHLQLDPKPEIKLVRCVRGAAFDVVLD